MLSCRKIFFLLFTIILAFTSCLPQKLLFNDNEDINYNFLKNIPGFGVTKYLGYQVIKSATKLDVYVASFHERYIQKNHLLEFSVMNDDTKIPPVVDLGVITNSQRVYFLKYQFTCSFASQRKLIEVPIEAVVFFTIKADALDNITTIKPGYFGVVDTEGKVISFESQLSLKKTKDHFYLDQVKQANHNYGVLFSPVNFSKKPTEKSTLNFKKIVVFNKNKVGGDKALLFDIKDILHDENGLQFHYVKTINITQ